MNTTTIYIAVWSAVLVAATASVSAATLRVPAEHPTIQGAVESAKSGDVVLVSAGTYKERLKLKPGVALRSAGDDTPGKLGLARAEATVIDGGGKDEPTPGVEMAEGSMLDGFTIANVGRYDEAGWKRHFETSGNEQPHEKIGAPGVAGVSVQGVNCEVRHNIVRHSGYTGIAITGREGVPSSPLIVSNVCYRNMGGGIGSMNGASATIRSNVCFENFFAGIGLENSSPLIEGNRCFGNIRAGIGISEGSCPTVRANVCYDNRRAGIGVRTGTSTRPLIEQNECRENGMAGIGVEEDAAPVLRGNRCFRNKLAGIGVRDHGQPVIIDNECFENGDAGIGLMTGAGTVLTGNHCHHNREAGVGFAGAGKNSATLANNRLIDNATVAVGIHAGWSVVLTGNTLTRADGMPPIIMVFEDASAIIANNTIHCPGVAGVRVAGRAEVVNNQFEGAGRRGPGPPNHAVWALPGAKVSMTANVVAACQHALLADGAEVAATGNTVSKSSGVAFLVRKPPQPPEVKRNALDAGQVELRVETK